MGRSGSRWLTAGVVLAAVAATGLTAYARSIPDVSVREHAAADAVDRDANAEADADADAAVVDPDAKGHGPQALNVPGHQVFIDTRKLTGAPVKRNSGRAEVELRDDAVHGGPAVAVQTT